MVKGDFSQRFYNSQPITRERFDELAILRLENTGKVTGAFEINLDAGWISGLCITDGWQTFQIKDVSAAAYHATRSSRMSLEDRWKKLSTAWMEIKSNRRALPLLRSGAYVPWRREIYSV